MDAPHVIPNREGDAESTEGEERGWWFSRSERSFDAHEFSDCDDGFEEGARAVAEAWRKEGPFDGVMAFSQVQLNILQLQACRSNNIYFVGRRSSSHLVSPAPGARAGLQVCRLRRSFSVPVPVPRPLVRGRPGRRRGHPYTARHWRHGQGHREGDERQNITVV